MIRFHKQLPIEKHAEVLAKIHKHIGKPHHFDGRHFLFHGDMPPRKNKAAWLPIYRAAGYQSGDRGSYWCPIDLEFIHKEGSLMALDDGTVHQRVDGVWVKRNVHV